ncbi:MAG: gliding motility-associated C-terminal domain-containing protein [Bacteroidetes bacterium]|nr:gliding motility-associated C-terminal domain-containing protein [Bacteroidota bacterium]
MNRLFITLLLSIALPLGAWASHNIAGEITYKPVGDPKDRIYEITVTTYTDNKDGVHAHRDRLDVDFDDGTVKSVEAKPAKVPVGPPGSNMWRNTYTTTHQFNGDGCYLISITDPNRVAGILNFIGQQSDDIPFYIQSELCINASFGAESVNNSPVLLEIPVSFGCIGKPYYFNPSAFDVDGDSLYFELDTPLGDKGKAIRGYVHPDDPAANGGNNNGVFTLDPNSGQISWITPRRSGRFNFAIRITEYRTTTTQSGSKVVRKMGYITRDMQIRIENCNNEPPEITPVPDTCVVAGNNTLLEFEIEAKDPNFCVGNTLTLSVGGGPFEVATSPARVVSIVDDSLNYARVRFSWRIDCSHIRKQPYQVVINATDNDCGRDEVPLADIKYFYIQVIGPEPQNPVAEARGNGILLDWEKPKCDGIVNYFVYRRENASNWTPDYCETGVGIGNGFKRITSLGPNELSYYDDNKGAGLTHGINYCYRITAFYKPEGQYEQVEGKASDEVCAFLKRDVPIITSATVDSTHVSAGVVSISWASPVEIDTVEYPGPYEYKIMRATNLKGNNVTEIRSIKSNTFKGLFADTSYTIIGLNTVDNPHAFLIDFYYTEYLNNPAGEQKIVGTASSASTPWLVLEPGYQNMTIRVETEVPWENSEFTVYRLNKRTNIYDSIGTTDSGIYLDEGLTIGAQYCYQVRTTGSFGVAGLHDPTINFSQRVCDKPIDTIPPCPPVIKAEANCDAFENSITWTFDDLACAFDVIKYNIYFQNRGIGNFELAGSIDGTADLREYLDQRDTLNYSLAGCYYVTAVDSYFNESVKSNIVCVDNCPEYRLPNVMTPNNDGFNDTYTPFPYRFIDSVKFTVYNRWGQEVFYTENPDINWDGKEAKKGNALLPGVYFYYIEYEELLLNENKTVKKTGTIHILE